jgi:hypothetical protein
MRRAGGVRRRGVRTPGFGLVLAGSIIASAAAFAAVGGIGGDRPFRGALSVERRALVAGIRWDDRSRGSTRGSPADPEHVALAQLHVSR